MPLTQDVVRSHAVHTPLILAVPAKANAVLFAGAITALDAGFAVPASDAAGLLIVGVNQTSLDNTGGANGVIVGGDGHGSERFVEVDRDGMWEFAVAGTAPVAGQNAFVVDDDTVSADATVNKLRLGQFIEPGLYGGWMVLIQPDLPAVV